MSTRKLILLALACGLAILVAGSIQLLRIRHSDTSTLAEGDSTELSTVTASVVSSDVHDGAVWVVARLAVSPDAASPLSDGVVGWSLLTGGLKKPVAAEPAEGGPVPSCAGLTVAPGARQDCLLRFPVVPTRAGTSLVTYRFVGVQATWALSV